MPTTPLAWPTPTSLFPWLASVDRARRVADAATDTRAAAVGQTPKRVAWARHQLQLVC
jgi:hypothetical protein